MTWLGGLLIGLAALVALALCLLVRKEWRESKKLKKEPGFGRGLTPVFGRENWILVAEASRKYDEKKAWIYYRVRKGVIPKRIKNRPGFGGWRIVVPEAWFERRADSLKLAKIAAQYKRTHEDEFIVPRIFGDKETGVPESGREFHLRKWMEGKDSKAKNRRTP